MYLLFIIHIIIYCRYGILHDEYNYLFIIIIIIYVHNIGGIQLCPVLFNHLETYDIVI